MSDDKMRVRGRFVFPPYRELALRPEAVETGRTPKAGSRYEIIDAPYSEVEQRVADYLATERKRAAAEREKYRREHPPKPNSK
jgi:hypothetical protein